MGSRGNARVYDLRYSPAVTAARRKRRWLTILRYNPVILDKEGDDLTAEQAILDNKIYEEMKRNGGEKRGRKRKSTMDNTRKTKSHRTDLHYDYE